MDEISKNQLKKLILKKLSRYKRTQTGSSIRLETQFIIWMRILAKK
jgi:hypothetical protein